jgi:flagellar hook-associated protein 1 FlgK
VNAVQAAGRTPAGASGAPLFAAGTPAFEVTMILTDPRGIAAAAPGEGTRGNGNLADLQALRASGGYEGGVDDAITGNAAALLARRSVADAQGAIRDSAVAARDAVSGVDLDEEAVDLIRFQQAYQASTRVIQVARETLQTIFDIR